MPADATSSKVSAPRAGAGRPVERGPQALDVKRWSQVPLPVSTTLFDIAFDTPDHGYLVGARAPFLETLDGGRSWKPRVFANLDEEEEVGYRFEKVSFKGREGWVVSKPPMLLHTTDSVASGSARLSAKAAGEPSGVTALGSKAEMTTSTRRYLPPPPMPTRAELEGRGQGKDRQLPSTVSVRRASRGVLLLWVCRKHQARRRRQLLICSVMRQLLPRVEAQGRLLVAPQPRDAAPHHGHGLRRQQCSKWSLDDPQRGRMALLELPPILM